MYDWIDIIMCIIAIILVGLIGFCFIYVLFPFVWEIFTSMSDGSEYLAEWWREFLAGGTQ